MKAAKEGRMWGWKPPWKEWEERSGLVLDREEPLAGCCSRGVYRHVSADASMLSRTGLALTTVVRCVGLNKVFGSRGREDPACSTSDSMGRATEGGVLSERTGNKTLRP